MTSPAPTPRPLLRLQGVTKNFGGVKALSGVDFALHAGEVHAVLGENGAGKSTLIKILAGIHHPDDGQVFFADERVEIATPGRSQELGIRVIHQELALFPNLSIAENLLLGREPRLLGFLNRQAIHGEARKIVSQLGMQEIADVGRLVSELPISHQQLVEIARALSWEGRVLILDEPTSSLTGEETQGLFRTLRRLRSRGVAIIYITHRLDEVFELADRITVIRDGKTVGTQWTSEFDRTSLIRWMVGRDVKEVPSSSGPRQDRCVLRVENLVARKVAGVNLTLHRGEILGLAGLLGSGRTELAEALFGISPAVSGKIFVEEQPIHLRSPRDAIEAGLVLVPEDRARQGLILSQSIAFNAALPWLNRWCRMGLPLWSRRNCMVRSILESIRVRVDNPSQAASTLSGGNQQKLLLGRWMLYPPKVLILDDPTRGVDVGAREDIYGFLRRLCEQGLAVLLISSDFEELLRLSDRVAIVANGTITATRDVKELNIESLLHELTGAHCHEGR